MPLIHCPNGYCDSIGNGCCFTKSGNCEKDVKAEINRLENLDISSGHCENYCTNGNCPCDAVRQKEILQLRKDLK